MGMINNFLTAVTNYHDSDLNQHLSATDLQLINLYCNRCEKQKSEQLSADTHASTIFDSLEFHDEIPTYILPHYFDEAVTEREKSELNAKYL